MSGQGIISSKQVKKGAFPTQKENKKKLKNHQRAPFILWQHKKCKTCCYYFSHCCCCFLQLEEAQLSKDCFPFYTIVIRVLRFSFHQAIVIIVTHKQKNAAAVKGRILYPFIANSG